MANDSTVISSSAGQNLAEDIVEAAPEHPDASAIGPSIPCNTLLSTSLSSCTASYVDANHAPQALTTRQSLRNISHSIHTQNTWASNVDAHVCPSLLTPPYTPLTLYPEINSMAGQCEINGELTEENNNMDENSNDQQFDQYSHFHHQHYMEQQAQAQREVEQSASSLHRENRNAYPQYEVHRINEAYNHRIPSVAETTDQNHVQETAMNSYGHMHSSGNERSVRPRIPSSGVVHRRMSYSSIPQHDAGTLQFTEPTTDTSSNSTSALAFRDQHSGQDRRSSYFVNPRQEGNWGHQRRRSCDSGIAHLLAQDNPPDERDYVQGLPTLPRPPHLHATADNNGYLYQQRAEDCELPHSHTATEREAQMLLYNFTREEISREHLAVPRDIAQVQGLEEHNLIRAGTELRKLADAFAATPARSKVRLMAQEVLMSDITWENFMDLCMQLFSGPRGITAERIVALFTFIADIAKEQIRRGAESCIRQLMTWSLRFIFQRVCQWVDSAGGWGRVLQQGLDVVYKVAVSVLAGVAAVALAAYISRTWRS